MLGRAAEDKPSASSLVTHVRGHDRVLGFWLQFAVSVAAVRVGRRIKDLSPTLSLSLALHFKLLIQVNEYIHI